MNPEENKELQEELLDYEDFQEEREVQEEEEEDPKKDKVIQNKFVFVLLCLLMFALPVLWYFGIGYPVNADGVFVGEIKQTEDGTLEIPMMLEDSAVAFTVTGQSLEDDVLILKPRFALVGLHESGSVVIQTKVPADELSEIWIQGDDETDRLRIWVNEDK